MCRDGVIQMKYFITLSVLRVSLVLDTVRACPSGSMSLYYLKFCEHRVGGF